MDAETRQREYAEARRNDPRPTLDLVSSALSTADDDAAWEAVGVLHWRGTREVFEIARQLCASECATERTLGADILGQLGIPVRSFPDECCEVLCHLLVKEDDADVLYAAAIACGHLHHPAAIEPLVRLQRHPDADVRHAVVFGLLGHRDDHAIRALIELSSDEETEVRDWATFGLGSQIETDTAAIREALLARTADADDETRGEALVGLAARKDPRVIEPLIRELTSDGVGRLSVEAAREFADPRLLPALLALDEWWEVDRELLEEALDRCRTGGQTTLMIHEHC